MISCRFSATGVKGNLIPALKGPGLLRLILGLGQNLVCLSGQGSLLRYILEDLHAIGKQMRLAAWLADDVRIHKTLHCCCC